MKIFVTDGDNRAALAIIRSLGKQGHEMYVGEKKSPSLAACSKYCQASITYPNPVSQPEEFITTIAEFVTTKKIDVILPVADVTTLLIAEYRHSYFPNCQFPFGNHETIANTANKAHVTELADSIGVPTPKTKIIHSASELNVNQLPFGFPVVIKPSRSRVKTDRGWQFTSVTYANDEQELIHILSQKPAYEFPILLQERLVGPGVGVFAYCRNGKTICQFSHKRLREKPPSGGISVLRESIPVEQRIGELSSQLLEKLQWEGVAMVEYKIDNTDQTPKLMEINGRFWGSLQLAIDAGMNFPALLIDGLDPNYTAFNTSYKNGVQTRWLWGDIDALLMLLLKSRKRLQLPSDHDGKLLTLLKFFKFWGRNLHYEVLKLNDMGPWFHETKRWLWQLIR